MAVFGFSEEDTKRIGRVVRLVERDATRVRLGGPEAGGASPGVRLLIGKHAGSAGWATGTTAVVTIYNGSVPGSVASALTLVAYNQYVTFSTHTHCTNRWVSLGHNGFGWHPVDAQSDCGTCISLVGGVDFRAFSNYAHTNQQVLGHDANGCVKWFDVTTCATASG